MTRTRLLRQLDACIDRPITVVCAPPGTGKTTLVADWITRRRDVIPLWFDLDARANDGDALTNDLACGVLDVGEAVWGTRRLVGGAGLGDRLSRLPSPGSNVVVVLDDAQELVDRLLWRDLSRLAAGSPAWLRWIIVTRVDPPLSLQRLQLQGRLAQTRVADLAFDVAEATALMEWFGLDIPSETIDVLVHWSEGWVSALCLAARTMLSGTDAPRPWEVLDVSQPLVLDLLVEEVLDRLERADRRFLLRLSAADLITPELAAELTGTVAAGERLHRLWRSGTFLLAVDPGGTQYRFHRLMATLLRARLDDEMPGEHRALASTAAHWYEAHGYHDEAERHGVRGANWNLVGRLRAKRFCDHLVHRGSIPPARGSSTGPEVTTEPSLYLLAVAETIRRGDRRAAERMLGDGAGLVDAAATTSPSLYRLVAHEYERWMPTGPGAEHLRVDRTRPDLDQDPAAGLAATAYLMVRRGESLLASGHDDEARRCLEESVVLIDAPDWVRHEAAAMIAVMDAAAGDPKRATALDRDRPPGRGNDAEAWLNVAAAISHGLHGGATGLRKRTEAIVHRRDGTRSWLLEHCTKLLTSVVGWRVPSVAPLVTTPAPGLPTSVAVALGVVETIDREGRTHPVGGPLERTIAQARRVLADGSSRRLHRCLASWHDQPTTEEHPRSVVELDVLLAIAELHHDRDDLALEHVRRALEHAAQAGLWAPFVAHEEHLQTFLVRHHRVLATRHPAAIELFERLRADEVAPMAPLTERERAVLVYLPTLMSNDEIASEMLVSVNTVKTHLKAIYRKLGVDRRRDAVMRARNVELL